MKIELTDASGVPEALKAVVAEEGGKHFLDLAGLVPATEVEGFKAKALTAQTESIERRKALDAWKKLGDTPEAVAAKLAAGADPAIVEQLRKQATDTEAAYKAKFGAVLRDRAMSDLKAELAKAGVIPEGLDVLAAFAGSRITFDDDGNTRIMAEDGKTPMVGKAANGGATLADLAGTLAAKIPHLVADKGAGGGGKPPGSGGKPGQKTITRAAFDAMSHSERAQFATQGGKVID